MSFHWDRIQSRITEIDPDVDFVVLIAGTPNQDGMRQLQKPFRNKALQHQHPISIWKIPEAKRPPIPSSQPLIYKFRVGLKSRSQTDFSSLHLAQYNPIQIDQDARSPDLMPISPIEHSGEIPFAHLLDFFADPPRSQQPIHTQTLTNSIRR